MDLMLMEGEAEATQGESRDFATTQLNELQLMLVGGGNVTVIVG